MIKSFANDETKLFYLTGRSQSIPFDIQRRALRKLERLDALDCLEDLRIPPSNRLEALKGKRRGQYSIRINQKYRICFRFVKGHFHDVEIVDYH